MVGNGNDNYTILDSLSMKVNKGEFISIMGPSGSGKSTLLNVIGGLDTKYSGEVIVAGQIMKNFNEDELLIFRRKHIGMIFQDFNLISTISVYDNLRLPFLFSGHRSYNEDKIDYMLNMVDMYDKKNETCMYLSGGEKQRVAIARSFMLEPELLLADEPTGSLDSKNSFKIMELLKHINSEMKTTIVLVTHDENMAAYGNRRIFLKDGVLNK
ncbi:ABC transporter ATP-binding protein [Lachnospiraceae bacterium]|nr:ABC transporter ATP-binding protein [Lachnospiraceae bacterium]